ncbi:unnamed protein product, partial [Menidia menidia]
MAPGHRHTGTASVAWTTCSRDYYRRNGKPTAKGGEVPSPLQRNVGGGGNVPVRLCYFVSAVTAHTCRAYSSPMCIHCPTKLMNSSCRWGNAETAPHLQFCFTETWLYGSIPDSALQLAGFQLFRADRNTELSGKTKGGGICFYTNSGWCNDVTVIQQHCSLDLETFFINCKPFYSPREFASFILVGVYIPPQANVQDAQRTLADQILRVERTYPDSLVIVLGDFNKGNLTHELPKYRQLIKCPTREENILDHCYTPITNAYHAVPRAALGHSDHVMVHLIPAYRQKLKLCKPAVRTSKQWSSEAVEDLQACLETTDWDVFRTATTSLDEYTEAVTSYISFCEDCCIPSRTRVSYNNDKPWFSPKLRQLRLQKEEAFRSGDRDRYKESKYRFSKAVRDAKRLYAENLKQQLSANDSASVWKGLRQITNYKPEPPPTLFERQWDSPNTNTIPYYHQPLPTCIPTPTSAGACPHPKPPTLKDPPPSTTMTLSIQERDVSSLLRKKKNAKQLDPTIFPSILKHYTDQLSPVTSSTPRWRHAMCLPASKPPPSSPSPKRQGFQASMTTDLLRITQPSSESHISHGDESAYRWEIDRLVSWCAVNNWELNALKTVEMVVHFRENTATITTTYSQHF